MSPEQSAAASDHSPARKQVLLLGLAALATLLFAALCVWQVERRAWKLALIEAVTTRVHAVPAPAPSPAQWPRLTARTDAYRHVATEGVPEIKHILPTILVEREGTENNREMGCRMERRRRVLPLQRARSAVRNARELPNGIRCRGAVL